MIEKFINSNLILNYLDLNNKSTKIFESKIYKRFFKLKIIWRRERPQSRVFNLSRCWLILQPLNLENFTQISHHKALAHFTTVKTSIKTYYDFFNLTVAYYPIRVGKSVGKKRRTHAEIHR